MSLKTALKNLIPPDTLNNFLLTFPSLYRTRIINYETNLQLNHGIDDLLAQLTKVMDLQGNIIECGSSRCGASIIMANYLRSKDIHKTIYACDSFEGFDLAELARERMVGLTVAVDQAFTSTSYEYVKRKITKLGLEDTIVPIKGFFETTLPHLKFSVCFALIDCDLRDSTIFCAETIWPNLVSGGGIVFDDYKNDYWKGARYGVDQFVSNYKDHISEHGLIACTMYAKRLPRTKSTTEDD